MTFVSIKLRLQCDKIPVSKLLRSILLLSLLVACSPGCGTSRHSPSFTSDATLLLARSTTENQSEQLEGGTLSYVAQIELGEEYSDYRKDRGRTSSASSPEPAGGGFFNSLAWYLPNRFLDLLDIVRFEVGVGPSIGGSLKLTRWGQVAYRQIEPFSLRVGLRGREWPFLFEQIDEVGLGADTQHAPGRITGPFEFGAGADLLVVGAYGGVCVDEVFDFLLGIFGVDLMKDDVG